MKAIEIHGEVVCRLLRGLAGPHITIYKTKMINTGQEQSRRCRMRVISDID